jgi:hypothetical protein
MGKENGTFRNRSMIRSIAFILIGVAVLVLKASYRGPMQETVLSYGGNVAISFSVYFWATLLPFSPKSRRLISAAVALLVVQVFEATDGFGFMGNVYDGFDFLANIIGVGVAVAVDTAVDKTAETRAEKT